ncbi:MULTISPECIES: BCCT family transporter [Brevibacterium]|uniref:BCCT family transporter n=1 Tax=Brevibacterium aurantiacum TaxID=273384 RepID=A0A2A3Z3C2_BREAU|nr:MULTISPECIES: BCCT family transporter [Brevibacterium]MDN5774581.1 BCCT family transporter [Brevibacterium aurantiacum]PCC18557.1 glycine/betaine ABC transporter permease [Brevibacterium aurantiacum]PCC46019.1 glycine/betaine ABC transporter permease [Brevibacterium aurantiacum]TGD37361.1 BCCT family transporter [Brevibacterium aurantiacum]WCE40490.1 BCCT family transporter [Brevibacterium sp. BDJS002]
MTMLDNHVPEPEPDPGSEADSEPDPAASTTDAEQAVSQDTGSARRSNIGSVFYWSVAFVIAFVLWAAISPESLGSIMTTAMTAVSSGFGWIYLVVPFAAIVMLVWFAASRFGRLRLGSADSRPEYSTFAWLAMVLAAVMGIGLVSYGVAEPMSHFMVPPHGLAEPETMDAAVRAMQFSYLDWGFQAWAIFGVFGLAIGYSTHRKGRPALVSTMLRPVLGRFVDGWVGKFIDILTIIATLFGTTTSLGLGASQIGEGLKVVFGVDATLTLQVVVIGVLTLLFTGSALSGVGRGIKYVSQITLTMATILGLFVFITGPSGFVANLFVRSVGSFAGDFLQLSFMTPSSAADSEWMLGWTYFMMAWWLSWSAFVGIFLAKISKGRTIRQFVAGVLLVPSAVFFLWFTIMGGSAIKLDMGGAKIGEATSANLDTAFFSLLEELPLSLLASIFTIIMVILFFVSSADSNTFVLSSLSSRGSFEPNRPVIATWGFLTGACAIVLLLLGGLQALQQAAMLSAVPFTVIVVVLGIALIKELKSDHQIVEEIAREKRVLGL